MGFLALEDNRVFWLFHLGLSIVFPAFCSSETNSSGGDCHILASVVRKPPLCSTVDHISHIGDDLLTAILTRLPNARTVFQCRSVCKRWSSLISSPEFGHSFVSHRRRQQRDEVELPLLTSCDFQSILSFLPVPDEIRPHLKVLDSFNELVLCGFVKSGNDCSSNGEMGRLFLVCNPFTGQWIALPLAPKRSVSLKYYAYSYKGCLVCEPRTCITNTNLDSGGRFRVVVHVYGSGSPDRPIMDMFCSESGEWMEVALDVGSGRDNLRMVGDMMNLCNGSLCWPAKIIQNAGIWNPFGPHVPPTSISAIPECLKHISYSKYDVSVEILGRLSVSRGALYTIFVQRCHRGWSPLAFYIWRWEEEGRTWEEHYVESWRKLIMRGNNRVDPRNLEVVDVLGMHPGKPEIVFVECRRGPGSPSIVISCNLKAKELQVFTRKRNWRELFQPRFTCWPVPIPGYEKLRGAYDGRYSCLVQSC